MDLKKLVLDLEADDLGAALFLTPERTSELSKLTITIAKRNVGKDSINKLLLIAEVQNHTNDIQEYSFVLSNILGVAEKIQMQRHIKEMASNFGKAVSKMLNDLDDE